MASRQVRKAKRAATYNAEERYNAKKKGDGRCVVCAQCVRRQAVVADGETRMRTES